jgi:hypothetical protein
MYAGPIVESPKRYCQGNKPFPGHLCVAAHDNCAEHWQALIVHPVGNFPAEKSYLACHIIATYR